LDHSEHFWLSEGDGVMSGFTCGFWNSP